MRQTVISSVIAVTLASAGTAQQQDQGFEIGVNVGALGTTVEGSYRLSDDVALRFPLGFGSEARDSRISGTEYDGELTIGGLGVVADYFPGNSAVRLSGGALIPNYQYYGEAQGNVSVNGSAYGGSDLVLQIRPEARVSPILSLGYDRSFDSGWSIRGDVGAIITGGANVSLTDRNNVVPQDDLAAEADSIGQGLIDVIPYLQLGVDLKF